MNLHQGLPQRGVDGGRVAARRGRTKGIEAALAAVDRLSWQILHLQEEERQRIASELHDTTAQHLTAIGLNLMNLRRLAARDRAVAALLADMETSLSEAQREIRVFSYLLHPPHLEQDGLKATLRRFTEGFSRRAGLIVDAAIPSAVDRLAIDLQRCMLRIVQEALANVHRHASARCVAIRIGVKGATLSIRVSDDGKGMGDAPEIPLGLGLPGMRARLALFGGRLRVTGGTGGIGTEIAAFIPLTGKRKPPRAKPARRARAVSGAGMAASLL